MKSDSHYWNTSILRACEISCCSVCINFAGNLICKSDSKAVFFIRLSIGSRKTSKQQCLLGSLTFRICFFNLNWDEVDPRNDWLTDHQSWLLSHLPQKIQQNWHHEHQSCSFLRFKLFDLNIPSFLNIFLIFCGSCK